MPTSLISASGPQFGALVTSGAELVVTGSVTITNSISVATGSESYIFGKSGTSYFPISVDGNGVLNVNASVTAGSESYIPAGSVIVTNTVGVSGNVLVSGTVATTQSTNPWIVLGSAAITNTVSVSGNVLVSGTVLSTQGTNPWIVLGSAAITNSITGSFAITTSPVPISGAVSLTRAQTILFAPVNASSAGNNQIVAAVAGQKTKVLNYVLVAGSNVTVAWISSGGVTSILTGSMTFYANGGISSAIGTPAGGHLLETGSNAALILNLVSAVQVGGHISYYNEA